MGVIAFVRQAFLDAQHYGVARGARQPTPTTRAGSHAASIDRKMPVAFEANQTREILRALKIAKELNLEPIVTGGREADERGRRPEGAERPGHLQPELPPAAARARARCRRAASRAAPARERPESAGRSSRKPASPLPSSRPV